MLGRKLPFSVSLFGNRKSHLCGCIAPFLFSTTVQQDGVLRGILVLYLKAASFPFKKFKRFKTNKMTAVLPKHVAFTVLQGGKIDCFRPFSCLPDQSLNDKSFLVFPVLTSKFCSSIGTKNSPGLFWRIPPGLRVYKLRVDFLYNQSVSGFQFPLHSTWIPRTKCLAFWEVWGSGFS